MTDVAVKYRTIVADPPWHLKTRKLGKGGRRARTTEVPYEFMPLEAIKALDVAALADDDAVLFLWSTRAMFRRGVAVDVCHAWGFRDAGEIIWGLRNPGTGGFLGNGHEPVLVGTRGRSLLPPKTLPAGVTFWKQPYGLNGKEHSAKPPGFMDYVESIAPGPYLELFARRQRLGWDTWGNEALEHVQIGGTA